MCGVSSEKGRLLFRTSEAGRDTRARCVLLSASYKKAGLSSQLCSFFSFLFFIEHTMAAMAALAQHHKTQQTAVGGGQLQQATTASAVSAPAPAAAAATAESAPQVRAFLPGAASLIEQLDTRVLVILRDGRHLVGTLRSLDQFSNLVLEDSFERHIVENKYADIYLGLYIVRGESVVMVAEIVSLRGEKARFCGSFCVWGGREDFGFVLLLFNRRNLG
jgi:small nuclear ribonucleoprotein (snRNP)-like protein